jgi:hypothetical protein
MIDLPKFDSQVTAKKRGWAADALKRGKSALKAIDILAEDVNTREF